MTRIVLRSLFALVVLYLVGRLLLGQNGLLHQFRLESANKELEHSIDSLELVLQNKKEERNRLLYDTLYIEQIARTHFGFSRPEELVYQFLPPQDSLMKDSAQPPTEFGASK